MVRTMILVIAGSVLTITSTRRCPRCGMRATFAMPGGVASVLDVTVMARHANAVVVPTLIRKVASELGRN